MLSMYTGYCHLLGILVIVPITMIALTMIALCKHKMSLPQIILLVFTPLALALEITSACCPSELNGCCPLAATLCMQPMVTLTGGTYGLPLFQL